MKVFALLALTGLSACSWFGSKRLPVPDPTELIVTGAPLGSTIFVDGVHRGETVVSSAAPHVLRVVPGSHTVEIRVGEPVVYREETDVIRGEMRVVTVLSGFTR